MNNELIVFLHNDLDAALSQLNFEFAAPSVRKKHFYTNYGNMKERINDIENYINTHRNDKILIMDVSFSNNKDQLDRLYNMFEQITLIDHHQYPEDFWLDYPKLKLHYDKSKCAALLSHEFFKNAGKNSNLDLLTKITDIYDLWQDEHEQFDTAQNLNNFFWNVGMDNFVSESIRSNYGLPHYYSDTVKQINDKIKDGVAKLEQRNLIHRFGKCTVVFSDDFFNDVLVREHRNGQHVVINAMSYGIIKVRISKTAPFSDEMLEELSRVTSGVDTTGHKLAWTYKINSTSFENIMAEIQRIVKETYRICYE